MLNTSNDVKSLLEQLHDIEGLDSISSWPLAMGWWVLIAIGMFMISAASWFVIRRLMFKRSWKNDAFQKLASLEKNLVDATARETVIALSEYLRRIVLQRFSRNECAGLVGKTWLQWLTEHDPKKFDWTKRGMLLIEVPYAPIKGHLHVDEVKDLIQATREWVC